MAPSLPCPRTRDPPLSPPSALAEIFRQACLQSRFHKFPHFPVKIGLIGGIEGIPQISFSLIPNIFDTKEPMQNSKTVAHILLVETAHFGFCPPKIGFFRGQGGVPEFFLFIAIFIFLLLRSPCKISIWNVHIFVSMEPIQKIRILRRLLMPF